MGAKAAKKTPSQDIGSPVLAPERPRALAFADGRPREPPGALVSGLRYVFPAQLGLIGDGMPTAFSLGPLADQLRLGDEDRVVYPRHFWPEDPRNAEPREPRRR